MGRDLLKEHVMWQVMDGKDNSIWEDKWIPDVENKRVGHPGILDSQIPEKVAEIMNKETGERILDSVEQWIS